MILNASKLANLYKAYHVIFMEQFAKAEPFYPRLATVLPSSAKIENYNFLDLMPSLIEWVDERTIKSVRAEAMSITNKDWELTIGIPRDDIFFDRYGLYNSAIADMAIAAKLHPDDLVADLLNNSFATACYDSEYFFDTDHPIAGGTQSNKETHALSETYYAAARVALRSIKDYGGRPWRRRWAQKSDVLLVVPPALENTARGIVDVQINSSGASNLYYNTAEVLVLDGLTSTTAWFLIDNSQAGKPFIFQYAKQPEFIAHDDPDKNEEAFMRKQYIYGVDTIDNAGYFLYQLAYGSTGVA